MAYRKHAQAGRWCRMTPWGISRTYAAACAVSLCAGTALAQSATHPVLTGMIVDSKRAPLWDALITAVDSKQRMIAQAHTDSAGEFALQGLAVGIPYRIIAGKLGFVTMETEATLPATDTVDLDILLAKDTITTWTPTSARPSIHGTVADSLRAPLASVLVTVLDSATKKVVAETRTDTTGRFAFDSLPVGVPYCIAVRKLGAAEGTTFATLPPGYSLSMKFVLVPTRWLAPVHVTANADREFHDITAREIAKADLPLLDAYDIVLRLRPFMLGNPFKGCVTDTSKFTFGPPRPADSVQMLMQDPRKFTLGVGGLSLARFKNGGWLFHRKAKDSSSLAAPRADSAYPFHFYINGVMRDGPPGAKNILSQIPIDDIQEMRYIDCLDTLTPQYRNSLMITLKPGKTY